MGFLWELHQQGQLRRRSWAQEARTFSLEDRIAELERQVAERDELLGHLIERLETVLGQDLDGDGTIGRRSLTDPG
jgi:hypothetical protein